MSNTPSWLLDSQVSIPFGTEIVAPGMLAKAVVCRSLFDKLPRSSFLVITETKKDAHDLVDHLKFFLGGDENRVLYVPALDFDFYKEILPNEQQIGQRQFALTQMAKSLEGHVFVTPIDALLQKSIRRDELLSSVVELKANLELDRDQFVSSLNRMGYHRQPVSYDPGTYAVRGSVVDVYTVGQPHPVRLEFYGDLIETVRFYDPSSQRSLDEVETVSVIPVGAAIVPPLDVFDEARTQIKSHLDDVSVPKKDRDVLLSELEEGKLPSEANLLFPLISGGSDPVSSFFPEKLVVLYDGKEKLSERAKEHALKNFSNHHKLFVEELIPIAPLNSLFCDETEVDHLLAWERSFCLEDFVKKADSSYFLKAEPIEFTHKIGQGVVEKGQGPIDELTKRLKSWTALGETTHLVCHTSTQEDRMKRFLASYELAAERASEDQVAYPDALRGSETHLKIWQGAINGSVRFPDLGINFVSEEDVFGKKRRVSRGPTKRKKKKDANKQLAAFRELKEGDFVVHRAYGIAKYLGLRSMKFLGVANDYALLEYRDSDKLYVPVYHLNAIQKFVGGEGAKVAVDKLGGERWEKAKKRAESAAQELAGELIRIQAKRKSSSAHACPTDAPADFERFEAEFPFDETPDQSEAIESAVRDLQKTQPMDRLVVGDVGYGKTEVAMRAAYRMALEGKQVCIVVPTTVLAFQHFENFKRRFHDTAVKIGMVSRLNRPSANKSLISDLAEGKVDIIIGTHRLFSDDIRFKDLGLVIVDEEHRFGVLHKEKLKKTSESVHLLTLTATPIPRTLNMAMTGIKEISLITTPPVDRMAVRTFVCRRSDEVIAEAITNELARGGQVFFLHNRVETIFGVADELRELLPRAKFEVVHGQMDGKEIEKKMLGFYNGDFHVLVTTSIIESGLDVPRANTIVMDRADRLGLAQLYQLRGRVGRSATRAFCYLLIPSESELTPDAKQRLQAIQRYSELGSGFNVASYDLELRGSGDLLGKEQSGHINAVGIDLYFELLDESVRALKGEKRRSTIEPEIHLKLPAYFPHAYLPDVSTRVALYRRLSSVESEEEVVDIEEEIVDRFGGLPAEVKNLIGLMRIKLFLKMLHVTHLKAGPKKISLRFAPSTPVEPSRIVELVAQHPDDYSLTPEQKLVIPLENEGWEPVLDRIQNLCEQLAVN